MKSMILNKKKNQSKKIFIIPILFFMIFSVVFIDASRISGNYSDELLSLIDDDIYSEELNQLKISTNRNGEIIDEIFDRKLSDYADLGYFPQKYEPSLEATYHALYVLNAIDRLDMINQEMVIEYIMSQFKEDSHLFIDMYTLRYLDMYYSLEYYPLNSLLETQCYALLSLDILNAMDLIDQQSFIDFIWSCFNPEGDDNGFIGIPWDAELDDMSKIATMDNTYYAIQTLNLLIDDWNAYGYQVAGIVRFINSLQSTFTSFKRFGGFFNDIDMEFDSMHELFRDISLLSSYYCIKTLETFDFLDSIRIDDFHDYLGEIYVESLGYFGINDVPYLSSLIASALALELSEIVDYAQINSTEISNLIQTNRNVIGNWDNSFSFNIHESTATYLIVQSLNNAGYLPMYTEDERDEIAKATLLYYQEPQGGFSLLSQDYVSLELIHTIVSAFDSYNRIQELQRTELYETIEDCFLPHAFPAHDMQAFFSCTNMDDEIFGFVTNPIEYICLGKQLIMNQTNHILSVESTFKALDSLEKLFRLDDFVCYYDIPTMIEQLVGIQFLNNAYINHGAFLPYNFLYGGSPELKNKSISLKYAYFTLKTLDLLTKVTEHGDILDFSFDSIALYNYLMRNLEETEKYQYFNSYRTSDVQILLRETYFMTWILDAIELNVLNKSKIERFILDHLDYGNLENIFYSYKLRNILGLNFDFDPSKTKLLIESCYCEINEFLIHENSTSINQEAFMWVTELAQDDSFYIDCTYNNEILLGAVNDIFVSISNIVLSDFGNEISIEFQNDELGCKNLVEIDDGLYQTSFQVPESADFYQDVEGVVKIMRYQSLVEEIPINFKTTLKLNQKMNIVKKSNRIEIQINTSYEFYSGQHATSNSTIIAKIFSEEGDVMQHLKRNDHDDYSTYSFIYVPTSQTNYYFQFNLFDDFHPEGLFIGEYDINTNDPNDLIGDIQIGTVATFGLIIGIPLVIIFWRRKKNRVNVVIHNNLNEKKESKSSHTKNYLKSQKGE